MTLDPVLILSANAAAQILVSSLLGVFMLVPMQPWGRALAPRVNMKALLAAHLDWVMLAFMQWGAAFCMDRWPSCRSTLVAGLLISVDGRTRRRTFCAGSGSTRSCWRGRRSRGSRRS